LAPLHWLVPREACSESSISPRRTGHHKARAEERATKWHSFNGNLTPFPPLVEGIEELKPQQVIDYELLDGQNKVEVQASLGHTYQPGRFSHLLAANRLGSARPSIAKAKRAGIGVITLNIDATEAHAAHVEMNHYFGAMDIAKAMGDAMGGKGKVAILNAPPGIIIRDQRTNGFVDGLKQHHPDIQVVADQVADWDRKKAQDVLNTILAANPDLGGVYGVNDSMALGAVDVAKEKGLIGKLAIFGNDGEIAALESIEAGELTGTQYTDVYQQGRLAAAAATVLATGGVAATAFTQQSHLLMPYVIATRRMLVRSNLPKGGRVS
jgi:ABC-type sugar transport system substrate-binding protein